MTRDEIAGASRADGGMFAVIPAIVMKDAELSMSARMLYGILTWKCNEESRCWPTNRALGEDLGLSPKRISALLSLLESRGHIETELIYDEATGQVMKRYIYPVMKSGRGIPKNKDTPPREQGDPPPRNAEEKHKEETKREVPPKAPQGGRRRKQELSAEARKLLNDYVAGDKELAEAMVVFMEVREASKKATNSDRAIKLLLAELDKLSGGDRETKLKLVKQSGLAGWVGLFPLKSGGYGGHPPGKETHDEYAGAV